MREAFRGGRGADMPGLRAIAAPVRGHNIPLSSAPAWVRKRALAAGWRPLANLVPPTLD